MNRQRYRLVFNRARGQLMAVAETATRTSCAPGQGAGRTVLHARVSDLRLALAWAWGAMAWAGLALPCASQIQADRAAPAAQQPSVLKAPNGVPLVNIQTPSAAGVSRNTYSRFDIPRDGAILNNSRTAVQSQLGGWVLGNPWLARGAARIILNEVNSSHPSRLQGYAEVAGQRAQLVIANPAGISCDGCGFINTPRVTLTTGAPRTAGGDLAGLRVERGEVHIVGQGLDGRQASFTDIIARAVRLDASVHADQLTVIATGQDVALDTAGSPLPPAAPGIPGAAGAPRVPVAIDVSSLGGMYAGRILLVGHGAGVGVRNAGHLGASAGDIVVTTDGRLENLALLKARGDARLDAQAGMLNAGTVYARGDVRVSIQGDIDHSGVFAAGRDLTLSAQGPVSALRATSGSLMAAGVQEDARVGATGRIDATASGALLAQGRHFAGAAVDMRADQVDLSGSKTQAEAIALRAVGGDMLLSGADIVAVQDLSVSATGDAHTDDAVLLASRLRLEARSLGNRAGWLQARGDAQLSTVEGVDNAGGVVVAGTLSLQAGGQVTNAGGSLASADSLWVHAHGLDNREGQVQAVGDVTLSLRQALDNTAGLVRSNQSLGVAAVRIVNDGTQGPDQGLEGQSVQLQADGISNRGGAIRAGQSLVLDSAGQVDNRGGLMSSGGALRLQSARAGASRSLVVSNTQGRFIAEDLLEIEADRLGGDGELLSHGDIGLHITQDYRHTGNLRSARHATLDVQGTVVNEGAVSVGGALRLQVGSLDNRAPATLEGQSVRIATAGPGGLVNRGLIAGEQVDIDTVSLNNLGTGRLYGDRVALRADTLVNDAEGSASPVVAARERLDLGVGALDNREHALIFSAGDLAIGRDLDGDRQASGRAHAVRNTSATIEALGALRIAAREMVNADAHFRTEDVDLPAQQVTELAGAGSPHRHAPGAPDVYVYNDESDHLHTPEGNYATWHRYEYTRQVRQTRIAQADPGRLLSGSDMQITAGAVVNDKGQILAGGHLAIHGGTLTNTAPGGTRITQDSGEVITYSRDHQKGRDATRVERSPYLPPERVETISLGPSVSRSLAPVAGSGMSLQPVAIAGVGARAAPQGSAELPPEAESGARAGRIDPRVPASSLFRVAPDPASRYLVETDPRFADHRQWLGSDYLLKAQAADLASLHKRLGDGFYEQRLIREQVVQLTGQRFLADYTNDDAQFRALMDNGLAFARTHSLRPGVALTAQQMAQLTSNIVWLVEQEVILPDGRTVRALVPQVYTRVREGDAAPASALIAGRAVNVKVSGDLANSGMIQAREGLVARALNLRNVGGRVAGSNVLLRASEDLENIGAQVRADQSLVMAAGQDVRIASTTTSTANAQGARTAIDRVARLQVDAPDGQLSIQAERDIHVAAADVRSEGALDLHARRDLDLAALDLSAHESIDHDSANHRRESHATQAGSALQARGNLTLQAGQDLTARAASVSSVGGALTAQAGRDLRVSAGESRVQVDEAHRATSRGLLSRKTTDTQTHLDETTSQATTFSGRSTDLQAGRDLVVTGSEVVSDDGTRVAAGRDVTLRTATETRTTRDSHSMRRSGAFGSGGFGITLGTQSQSSQRAHVITSAAGSTVGSVNGDVRIEAGSSYQQVGSQVLGPRGDVEVAARHVEVLEARETERLEHSTQARQSGLTVSLSNPVATAAQTVNRVQEAVRESRDGRSRALAVLAQGLALYEAGSALEDDPTLAGGVGLSISLGASQSASRHEQASDTAAGSRVLSGGDVRLRAVGAGQASELVVQGARVQAAGAVVLQADSHVVLQAARNLSRQHSEESSSGAAVGMNVGLGSTGAGLSVTANASKANGRGDGQDQSWTNANVSAGTAVRMESGADTVLRGAVVDAPQVLGRVGGNLWVESLQDTSRETRQQQSVGAGVVYGSSASSVTASGHRGTASMDHATVVEQSGVVAGAGGFDLQVQGRTDLKAGFLASSEEAALAGRNRMVTGAITFSDLDNTASVQASSNGFAFSSDMATRGKYGVAKAVAANTLLQGDQAAGSTGRTRSAVSAGDVVITDEVLQKALTGESSERAVASLSRDTRHAHAGVLRPDLDAVQRAVNAQRVIKEETYRAITVFTDEAYRSRFESKPGLFRVTCRVGADCVNDPKQVVYTPVKAEEVANAPAGAVIAVNGILNDEKRGSELAYQNVDRSALPESMKPDKSEVYLMHIAPSRHTLSELMGVAYEKIVAESDYRMANFLGYTSGQALYADLLKSRGQLETTSLGHSRGTLVQKAAFTILVNASSESGGAYRNPNLSIRGVGGATGVENYTSKGLEVLGNPDKADQITFSYFSNDPISTSSLGGGNPGVSTLSDLWQVWKTANSMHSCYGSSSPGCTQVEVPLPGGPQGTPDGNAKLVKFVGGKPTPESHLQRKVGQ